MKKFITLLAIGFGFIFATTNTALAEEVGPVAVQAIVQEKYNLEITVNLVKSDTEEVVKTYKLNQDNNWIQKDKVPVGKYKIRPYIEGLSPRATTKVKATYLEKEVIANPEITDYKDKTPRFVVMEGDQQFLSDFYGLVDYERPDGSTVKGEVTRDKMQQVYQEAILSQRETNLPQGTENHEVDEHDDVAGPGHDHGLSKDDVDEVKSNYKAEKPTEVYQPKKIKAEKESVLKTSNILIAGVVLLLVCFGGYRLIKRNRNR